MVLQGCEELFDLDQLSAVPSQGKPGQFEPSLFVYKPNVGTFEKLIGLAEKLKTGKCIVILSLINRIILAALAFLQSS